MKILIVDDNDSINKALSRFLEFNGYSCELLSEPENAVDKIIHGSYDLVILDLAMPKISGYDIIEQLNKSGKIINVKILINTASTLDDANREKLFQSGVKGFNLKTNDPEILLAKIKEIINN
jgi:DNA-binding response OmpR family regulator